MTKAKPAAFTVNPYRIDPYKNHRFDAQPPGDIPEDAPLSPPAKSAKKKSVKDTSPKKATAAKKAAPVKKTAALKKATSAKKASAKPAKTL